MILASKKKKSLADEVESRFVYLNHNKKMAFPPSLLDISSPYYEIFDRLTNCKALQINVVIIKTDLTK